VTTNNTFLRDDGQFVGPSAGGPRPVLTAPTTFYLATSGSDSNDGLTTSTPWLTPAPLASRFDFGGQNVTLKLNSNFSTGLNVPAWTGGGKLIIDLNGFSITGGAGTTPNSCILTPLFVPLPGDVVLINSAGVGNGGTLSNAGGGALGMFHVGRFVIGTQGVAQSGITFGTCSGPHLDAAACNVRTLSGYYVSGGASRHWRGEALSSWGMFDLNVNPVAIHNSSGGALNFGIFALCDGGAQMISFGSFNDGSWATTTGQRYSARGNAVIATNSGANYFPGNAAGDTSTGGQYT
jgi:hypothetical protein